MPNQVNQEEAKAWLSDKWPDAPLCPLCRGMGLTIRDQLVEMPPDLFLAISCQTCGHTLFFDAQVPRDAGYSVVD